MDVEAGARRWSVRPERLTLWVSLAAIVALSWLYLLLMDVEMRAMAGQRASLGLMALMPMGAWGAVEFLLALAMWVIMMAGMMLPSALPVILLYEKIQRRAQPSAALTLTLCFIAGYLLIWSAFSLGATLLQFGLTRVGLFDDSMESANTWLRGGMLLLAGLYQFTPWKYACLKQCQSPMGFITRQWRRGAAGALQMGVRHGVYCLGCCWLLMLVLFAVGVMNLMWILILSAGVLAEKLVARRAFSYSIGAALVGLGLYEIAAGR